MRERHWVQVVEKAGGQLHLGEKMLLKDVLGIQITQLREEIGEIVATAQQEEKIEIALEKLGKTWAALEFESEKHQSTQAFVVHVTEEWGEKFSKTPFHRFFGHLLQ